MRSIILPKFCKYVILLFLIILGWMVFFGITWAKDVKVGFFDLDKLKSELPFFQNLTDVLSAKDDELEQFRGKLYKDYLKFYQENSQSCDREKLGKSAADQAQITEHFQSELDTKIKEMNDQIEQKRLENETFKTEQNQAVKAKVLKLVATISTKKKLMAVVEKDSVLYGGTDITDDIVKQFQKEEKQYKTQ